jgi:hypothetical protein
LDADLFHAALD